jgi:hypothetical protein
MILVMCGVEEESRRFGKIQTDFGRRFIVLWTDGTVSEEFQPKTKKLAMNSPSFFALVSPGRNQRVFELDPLQLALEVLWEKKFLSPQNCALDMEKIGRALQQAGVPKGEYEKAKKALSSTLKGDKRIKVSASTIKIIVEDFMVYEPVSFDWAALESQPSVIAQLDTLTAKVPDSTAAIELPSNVNLDATWREFYLQTTGKSREMGLSTEPAKILNTFLQLDERYRRLDKKSVKSLLEGEFKFIDAPLGLIASWITGRALETATGLGREQVALALGILIAHSENANQSSSADVAMARLSELLSEQDYLNAGKSLVEKLVTLRALSILPPGEFGYRGRLALCAEVSRLVSKGTSPLSKKEEDLLLQLTRMNAWGSSERKSLNEALFSIKSKIIENDSFWNSLDLDSLKGLTASPHWKIIVGRKATGSLLATAVVNLLSRLSPAELLGALPYADFLAEAVGQDKIPELLSKALTSSGALTNALSEISNSELIVNLRSEAASLSKKAQELEAQVNGLNEKLDSSSNLIREFQSRLAAVAQERSNSEDQNRERFEIEASRSLSRIMNVIEKYAGGEVSNKQEVQAALAMVGLSSPARLGEVMEFSFEIHEDPEGLAVEGDSVRVLASAYRWTGSTESVIVQKALVSVI